MREQCALDQPVFAEKRNWLSAEFRVGEERGWRPGEFAFKLKTIEAW